MKYTLILINSQGASHTTYHDTKKGLKTEIRSWADPENLDAKIYDNNVGYEIFEGSALSFK